MKTVSERAKKIIENVFAATGVEINAVAVEGLIRHLDPVAKKKIFSVISPIRAGKAVDMMLTDGSLDITDMFESSSDESSTWDTDWEQYESSPWNQDDESSSLNL